MSTEQLTVEQMNREIFDFMGCIHSRHKDMDDFEMSLLKYHSSWDRLMPVWFKIQSIGADIGYSFKKHYEAFHAGIDYQSINKCYKAVYDFITWYKTQAS